MAPFFPHHCSLLICEWDYVFHKCNLIFLLYKLNSCVVWACTNNSSGFLHNFVLFISRARMFTFLVKSRSVLGSEECCIRTLQQQLTSNRIYESVRIELKNEDQVTPRTDEFGPAKQWGNLLNLIGFGTVQSTQAWSTKT